MEADEPPVGGKSHDHHGADRRAERGHGLAKGAVRCEQGLRAKQYYPIVERQAAAKAETESFLGKVYGGSLGLMMSAMVESKGLTESDIAELSAILEQAGGNSK